MSHSWRAQRGLRSIPGLREEDPVLHATHAANVPRATLITASRPPFSCPSTRKRPHLVFLHAVQCPVPLWLHSETSPECASYARSIFILHLMNNKDRMIPNLAHSGEVSEYSLGCVQKPLPRAPRLPNAVQKPTEGTSTLSKWPVQKCFECSRSRDFSTLRKSRVQKSPDRELAQNAGKH